jgi:glycine/D-amino acid oxidase-like deaminating enzyme
MPGWLCQSELMYGMPDLESRGFKIAHDQHGPPFDPDTGARAPTAEGIAAAHAYVARRFPRLADAPLVEARVCQYENTSNGDFLVDRHPAHENVWLVGGGSGHGFKHGPAMGEHVAARVLGKAAQEPRFSLSTKATVQRRTVY